METPTYQHPVIELCTNCKATGIEQVFIVADKFREFPAHHTCPTCKGSGRVLISSQTITKIEPYNPPALNCTNEDRTELMELLAQYK